MISFVNNRFVEEKEACIGVADLAIQRGYGIFDFFRTSNYIPLFIDHYLDRFFHSADVLRLKPLHTKHEIRNIITEMISINNVASSAFRMILTGGYSPDSFEPASPNFIIIQQPVELPGKEKFDQGLKVIMHEYMRELPEAKSINYLMAVYFRQLLLKEKADEMLYFKNGKVLEFARSNVFIVTNEHTVVTPGVNVLRGITRLKVLEIARKKYKVEEREILVEELKDAAEIFLTSTTKRILPVLSIDNHEIGNGRPGEITTLLHNLFLKHEEEICQ